MVKDVLDGLKLVAEAIKSVKTIAEAIESGRNYLKARHPDVQADVRAMVAELGKSLVVIKRASAVLTNFRFAIVNDAQGAELARFNNYFIQSKTDAQLLRDQDVQLPRQDINPVRLAMVRKVDEFLRDHT